MGKKPINMLGESDVNHLRRLLGYVRCEIGQTPEEYADTVRMIVSKCGEPSEEGKARVVRSYMDSKRVPKYVREAVNALEKVVRDGDGSNNAGAPVHGSLANPSASVVPRE